MLEEAMEIRESQNANRQNQIKHITESVSGMHLCVYVCVCVCMYVCVRMWKIGIRERMNVYVCVYKDGIGCVLGDKRVRLPVR